MNGKPDWFLRLLLVAILLVLAVHVAVEYRTAPRYVPFGITGRQILDTRTGVAYAQAESDSTLVHSKAINYAVDFVGEASRQKK